MYNSTAVVVVFYPAAEKFFSIFIKSILNQNTKDFVLIIANDGVSNISQYFINCDFEFEIIPMSGTPSDIRVGLIKHLIHNNYKKVIFCDCDDIMLYNRVSLLQENLDKHDVIVNDINIISTEGKTLHKNYFSNRLKPNQRITINEIISSNFMGLTNTAAKIKVFNFNFEPQNTSLITYDWFLWSLVILNGFKVSFFPEIITKYRVHNNNSSDISKKYDKETIKFGLKIKYEHYSELSVYKKEYMKLSGKYEYAYYKINDDIWFNQYIKDIQCANIEFPFWWEKIIVPKNTGLK